MNPTAQEPSAPGSGAPARVLLAEWIDLRTLDDAKAGCFPFVLGWCRDRGIPARWVCFSRTSVPGAAPGPVDLEPPALDRLDRELDATGATHVLLSEAPGPGVSALLARRGVRMLANDRSTWHHRALEAGWLASWLGIPGPTDGFLVDLATPDWTCRALDDAAAAVRIPTSIIGGHPCIYNAPLKANPAYAGVDLDGTSRPFACAFCPGAANLRHPYRTPWLALLSRQLRAAADARETLRDPRDFVIEAARAATHVDRFLDEVRRLGLPPSRFRLWFRCDELLDLAPRIEHALAVAREDGHEIWLRPMGVENFSPTENRRLNKGITRAHVRGALDRIAAWKRAYPGTLRQGNEFGSILYTPWTTLEDLRQNLDAAREFAPEPRFFLTRRLMLLSGSAILRLAERDGLAHPADPAAQRRFERMRACDPGCRRFPDEQDHPWTFADPLTAAVCEITLRLAGPDRPEHRTALDVALAPYRHVADDPAALLDAFQSLLDAAAAHPGPPTAEALLPAFIAALRRVEQAVPAATRALMPAKWDEALAAIARLRPAWLRGFAVDGVTRDGPSLEVRFARDGHPFHVRVSPRDDAGGASFLVHRGFALIHEGAWPAFGDDHRALIALAVRVLDRLLGAPAAP